jgi:hypothetical protein
MFDVNQLKSKDIEHHVSCSNGHQGQLGHVQRWTPMQALG